MNRVAIILDANGDFDGVVADEEIEFYVVQPSCARDRVYKYDAVDYGPQHVQKAFDGQPVGHLNDGMMHGDGNYGKLAPSRPALSLVSPEDQKND